MSDPINDTEKRQVTNSPPHNQTKTSPFNALTPTCDADEKGHYSEMLNWALRNDNDNDIRNIALTGPYGSGKSSIIKTFEKNNVNKKLVFLNISLATFNEENEAENERQPENEDSPNLGAILRSKVKSIQDLKTEKNKEKQLRLIEYSILQQIFYHETDSKIPDSRFRKIQSLSEHDEYFTKLGIFVFVIALLYELFSKHLWGMLRIHPVKSMDITFHVMALGAMLYLGSIFIKKTIRPLRSIQFKKFNIQQAEFAVDDNISKSILNEHLDEILYFFEVTDYTVVVFEDLDRFDRPEIFTKLRELNHLINYSKKIERKVAFIYAVRDDMFFGKERTKFFDFIVPVIPVISFANSSSRLLNIVKENEYNISSELLEDISLFVDDMRLVYNIMNEYHIYSKNFEDLDQNLLLGLIVYKNIYPNDFVNLSKSEGILYNVLHKKQEYLSVEAEKIENLLPSLRESLNEVESLQYATVKQLRERYIIEILNTMDSFHSIIVSGKETQINELTSDENFTSIRNGGMEYHPFRPFIPSKSGYHRDHISKIIDFRKIENDVDRNETYLQKEEITLRAKNINVEEIKQKIAYLEQIKSELAHTKLKSLIKNKIEAIDFVDEKQEQFIYIMIKGGYIDENYEDYISIFYEGNISKQDHLFRIKVRSGQTTEFDHPLHKVDNLIAKIRSHEFEQQNILNYNLVDYILEHKRYHTELKQIMRILTNESADSISFIDGFITNGKNVKQFLNSLAGNWTSIWRFINVKSEFPEEKKEHYFILLIENLEYTNIEKIVRNSNLADYIESKNNFFDISIDIEKLKNIVAVLGIKFKGIDLENLSDEIFDFIYNGNYYALNPFMIGSVLHKTGNLNSENFEEEDEFYSKNYSFIQRTNASQLIRYVEENIDEYIEKAWHPVLTEKSEEEEYFLLLLLNNNKVSPENKTRILHLTKTKITNLENVKDRGVIQRLLVEKSIVITWDNLLYYFIKSGNIIDFLLRDYISDPANLGVLITSKLDETNVKYNRPDLLKFTAAIFMENKFSNETYNALLSNISLHLETKKKLNNLDDDKLKILLNKGKLKITPRNFLELKGFSNGLHIKLIEQNPQEFINDLNKMNYDTKDAIFILNSKKFSLSQKQIIITYLDDNEIIKDPDLVGTITMLIFSTKSFLVNKSILRHILTTEPAENIRLNILIKSFDNLTPKEIKDIVFVWPKPYSDLFKENYVVKLNGMKENRLFANYLLQNNLISKVEEEKGHIVVTTLSNGWGTFIKF